MIGNSNHGISLSKGNGDQRQRYVRGFAAKRKILAKVWGKERPHVFKFDFQPYKHSMSQADLSRLLFLQC